MSTGIGALATQQQLQNVQNDILVSLLKSTQNLALTTTVGLIDKTTQALQTLQLQRLGIGNHVNTLA